jgi:hypothetical protein
MKKQLVTIALIVVATFAHAQKVNFSGNWKEPELEMIDGIQYANAVPKKITVTQTKDSIKVVSIEVGDEAVPITQTFALNGKTISMVGKKSGRTFTSTTTWGSDSKTLSIVTTYSYANKPDAVEYKNTEVWSITANGDLLITKTSDATETDDWTIKATYKKQ